MYTTTVNLWYQSPHVYKFDAEACLTQTDLCPHSEHLTKVFKLDRQDSFQFADLVDDAAVMSNGKTH